MPKEPPFTMIPHSLVDRMAEFSPAAFNVAIFIARQTIGCQGRIVRLSYRGIRRATGIKSDATIAKALQELIRSDVILAIHDSQHQTISYQWTWATSSKNEEVTSTDYGEASTDIEVASLATSSKNEGVTSSNFEDMNKERSSKERESPPPSPPRNGTARVNPSAVGGEGGTLVEVLMNDYGVQSVEVAREITELGVDEETLTTSIDNLLTAGVPLGRILNRLRSRPPTHGRPYPVPKGTKHASIPHVSAVPWREGTDPDDTEWFTGGNGTQLPGV